VISNHFAAEYGKAMGAVRETITKSGANESTAPATVSANRTLNASDR